MTLSKFALHAVLLAAEKFATPEQDFEKLSQVAANIAAAVEESPVLPFEGSAAQEATVLVLTAISAHESGYRDEIRHCQWRGDHGQSVSMYQLHKGVSWYGQKEKSICSNEVLAGKLAIRVLIDAQMTGGKIQGMFRTYASGDPRKATYAADGQNGLRGMFFTLAKHPDFDIISRDGRKRVIAEGRFNHEQEEATTGLWSPLREAGEVSRGKGRRGPEGACCVDRSSEVRQRQDGEDGC